MNEYLTALLRAEQALEPARCGGGKEESSSTRVGNYRVSWAWRAAAV